MPGGTQIGHAHACLGYLAAAVRWCRDEPQNPYWRDLLVISNAHWHLSGLEFLEIRSSLD